MTITSPRASTTVKDKAPLIWSNDKEHLYLLAVKINELLDGKTNNIGTVTLTENQASTVLADLRIGTSSVISFMPTTANAAAEIGAGTMYVSSIGKQVATITHANNAQTDRSFSYTVIG